MTSHNARTGSLFLFVLLVALVVFAGSLHAAATASNEFPTKPIRFIVPFAPGGGNDLIARLLAQKLTESWNQQVVVDNRAGGGGVVGTALAAQAAPDGYTLLLGYTGTLAINPSLYRGVPYDPVKDFTPIALVASTALVLVVHPTVAAQNLPELIKLAKSKPGVLNFASGGVGTGSHLSGEMLKSMAGIDMAHVSYKGTGPALTDLLGGQIQLMFSVWPSALPHIAAKRLRPLAVTSTQRSKLLPELPTVAEAGLPGYESVLRYGVAGPKAMPGAVVQKLSAEIQRISASNEVEAFLTKNGAEATPGSAKEYAAVIARELPLWSKVVRASGATAR